MKKYIKLLLILLSILLPFQSIGTFPVAISQAAIDKVLIVCEQAALYAAAWAISQNSKSYIPEVKTLKFTDKPTSKINYNGLTNPIISIDNKFITNIASQKQAVSITQTEITQIKSLAQIAIKPKEFVYVAPNNQLYTSIGLAKINAIEKQLQKEEQARYSRVRFNVKAIPEQKPQYISPTQIYENILWNDNQQAEKYLNIVDNFCTQLINLNSQDAQTGVETLFNMVHSLGPQEGPMYNDLQHILTQMLNHVCDAQGKLQALNFNHQEIQNEINLGLNKICQSKSVNVLKSKFANNGKWFFSNKDMFATVIPHGTNYKNYEIISNFKENSYNKSLIADIAVINDLTSKLDYTGALAFANSAGTTVQAKWRAALINQRFTSSGILRKFLKDPLWKNLSTDDKKLITTSNDLLENGKTRLETFNNTLLLRYLAKKEIACKFTLECDLENICVEVDNVLYKLLDIGFDTNTQLELLCDLAKPDSVFYNQEGILKYFQNNPHVAGFKLNKNLPVDLKAKVIYGINKAILAGQTRSLEYYKQANNSYSCNAKQEANLYYELAAENIETNFIGKNKAEKLKLIQAAAKLLDKIKPQKVSRLHYLRLEILHAKNNAATNWFKMVNNPALSEQENKLLFYEVQDLLKIHLNEKNINLVCLAAQYLEYAKTTKNDQFNELVRQKYQPDTPSYAKQQSNTYAFLAKAVKQAINNNKFYLDLFNAKKILDGPAARYMQQKIIAYELENLKNKNFVSTNPIQDILLNAIQSNSRKIPGSNNFNMPMPNPNDPDDPRHELWHAASAGIERAIKKFNESKLAKDLGITLDKDGAYHIQHGNTNVKGKPSGYHFEGSDCCFEIKTIQYFGKGLEKIVELSCDGITKRSSLFPSSWTFEKTIDKIIKWYELGSFDIDNISKLVRIQSPCCKRIIELTFKPSGKIISFYPLRTKLIELAQNKMLDCAKCLK
ncbi:MAG: hypothetical protein P4L22_05535 [Candidatus Babeliales bacterium]|nr:hypothetical protein [Candidatus Babeliales bacterium]